jgi:hypothetical protein
VADDGVDQALLGQRVHPAVSQGRAHHRQILCAHVQRALSGVEVGRLGRVQVDPVVALEKAGDALVAEVGGRRGGVDFFVERKGPAGEPGQTVVDELPPGLSGRARYQARRCDRPRIHHRVRPAVRTPLDRPERVERQPRGIHPELAAGLLVAQRLTDQGEHERLGDAHDRELVLGVTDRVDIAAGADHANAEKVALHPGERRVNLGVPAFGHGLVGLVRFVDQQADLLRRRQVTGRNVSGFYDLIGPTPRAHYCRSVPASERSSDHKIKTGLATVNNLGMDAATLELSSPVPDKGISAADAIALSRWRCRHYSMLFSRTMKHSMDSTSTTGGAPLAVTRPWRST